MTDGQWKAVGMIAGILMLGVAAAAAATEALVLGDGSRVEGETFLLEADVFVAPDGTRVERERVVDWWAGGTTRPENDLTAPADADLSQLKAWRAAGRELAAKFPGTRGVHVIDDGEYVLTHDRHHVYRYHFVGLVLNEEMLEWGELRLGFSEGRSTSRILMARALTEDDRLHVLDPEQVTVGTPGGGAVHFDPNSRVVSATIPGVEVGAVVEYVYEYENYAPEDWRLFFPGFYFQSDLPVWQSTFAVRVPSDVRLYSWEDNWEAAGAERQRGWLARLFQRRSHPRRELSAQGVDGKPYRRHVWEKRLVPPIIKEPRMPPWYEVAPAVHATTMRTWDHLNTLTGSMQQERMQATPEVVELALQLTGEADTDEHRVAAIYHWVQKNIRYISVKSSLSSGWAGHPAAETLAQGYGDCTDKSVLFCTMLRSLGIAANPIVLRTNDRGRFNPQYPVLACNHCITLVHVDGQRLYLDTTSQDYRFPSFRADDHGAIGYDFIAGDHREIPVPPGLEADGKETEEEMTLQLNGDLTVHAINRYRGQYEAGLRAGWKRVPEAVREETMQQYLNGFAPGAKLLEFRMSPPQSLEEPFVLEFDYTLPGYVAEAGAYRILEIPDRRVEFPEVSLEQRRYPLAYTSAQARRRTVRLTLPEGMSAAELPANVKLENAHLRYAETFRQDGQQIVISVVLERCSQRVPPEDYPAYRELALRIQQQSRRPLYLQVGG